MRTTKKILSMILAFVLVLGLLPATVFATAQDENVVYLSISFDDAYIDDQNGRLIRDIPISLDEVAAVDLSAYGLENMWYDKADPDGDGTYAPTALQLIIYAHENLYGGDWSEVDFSALPGSSYFNGGVFGFTANLVYFLNGKFPIDRDITMAGVENVGATSDHIILQSGDRLHVSSFSCYNFLWSSSAGFHLFTDASDNYVYNYTVDAGEELPINLLRSFCDLMSGAMWEADASDTEIFYGTSYGNAENSFFTDESGDATVSFAEPGTYYLWVDGAPDSSDAGHDMCDHYWEAGEPCIVSAPGYAVVTVSEAAESEQPGQSETSRQPQDVSVVLNATMAKLAATVTEPQFGTGAGEWTVFSLARGGHYALDDAYFADYYDRIVATVNELATSVNQNGALDADKSTENSRLIVTLSALGKDSTAVGNWNLIEPYSANGLRWIAKQGFNGTIWALIALDSNNYETADTELRQTLVDRILDSQHDDGGWHLNYSNLTVPSNVDVTGMTLTALYPYRNQPEVAAVCAEAIAWLSSAQQADGSFAYDENASGTVESCAWAIVGLTTWGINPDTDPRFVKNGVSAVDNLLSYYVEDKAMFEHVKGDGGNHMGTDQACYALVAYDRFINGEKALFDYSDVTFTETVPSGDEMVATLGLPTEINPGAAFNATVSINKWDNEAGYKLIDLIVNIPEGVSVTDVTASNRLEGGDVSWNVEEETGKLRIVYFDANENTDLTITGEALPAELFTIGFQVTEDFSAEKLNIAISGMSIKLNSDSSSDDSMIIIKVASSEGGSGSGNITVVPGISFSAKCLYTGDDVDIIPSTKKAVAVAITGIAKGAKLTFKDGETEIVFQYSKEITEKTGVSTYIALVDAEIDMAKFIDEKNFTIGAVSEETITFGDTNGDGVVNAEDALAAVNTWLRVGEEPTDIQILTMNVNGDSRINTYDALGIVEAFVNKTDYIVVTKAATITENQ